MVQIVALAVSAVLVLAVLIVFVRVALAAGRRVEYAQVQSSSGRVRTALFWLLVVVCVPVIAISLGDLPYARPQGAGAAAQVVDVTARQWSWTLSTNRVIAGQPVEFRVTSADVNHGFGLYDSDLRLVGQTQAMPGYTNVLRLTLDRAETYRVMCLEYCGLVHHQMFADIEVVAP